MRKKKIALLFWFIVLATAIAVGAKLLDGTEKKFYSRVNVDDYGFSISYPMYYENIVEEKTTQEEISQTISSSVTEVVKNDDLSLKFVEQVIHAKSEDSGITLLVEAIKKEKTKKSIEEICKDYITMFRVFNSSLDVIETNIEEVEVNGIPAGKTTIFTAAKDMINMPGMISYLIPMEDREITIVFAGTKTLIKNAEKEIDKIIKSVKFYELPLTSNDVSGEISENEVNVNEKNEEINNESGNKSGE